MFKPSLICLAALSLGACVTTATPTSAELAYCQRMEREMGTDHQHDHAEAKGMGMNAMNATHARCRQMLGMS